MIVRKLILGKNYFGYHTFIITVSKVKLNEFLYKILLPNDAKFDREDVYNSITFLKIKLSSCKCLPGQNLIPDKSVSKIKKVKLE